MNYRTLLAGGLAAIVSYTSPDTAYSQKTSSSPITASAPLSPSNPHRYDTLLDIAIAGIESPNPTIRAYALSRAKPLFEDPRYEPLLKPLLEEALSTPQGKQFGIINKLKGTYGGIKSSILNPQLNSPPLSNNQDTLGHQHTKEHGNSSPWSLTQPVASHIPLEQLPSGLHHDFKEALRGLSSPNPQERYAALGRVGKLNEHPTFLPYILLLSKAASINETSTRLGLVREIQQCYASNKHPQNNPTLAPILSDLTRQTSNKNLTTNSGRVISEIERIQLERLVDMFKDFLDPLYREIILHEKSPSKR